MNLKKYLELSQTSYKTFSSLVGVTPMTVYRWVNGKRFPKYSELVRIEEVTGEAVTSRDFLILYKTKEKNK
tara:strand:+ start:290 stop:502 length:213 start_codon:yes stop_codon:yes gene_type:complete